MSAYVIILLAVLCGLSAALSGNVAHNGLGRMREASAHRQEPKKRVEPSRVAPRGNLKHSKLIPPPPGITAITDVLHSDLVTIVDQQIVDTSTWTPVDVAGHCSWLDPEVWNSECRPESKFYQKLEPITAYIAMVKDHYIDFNSVHEKVPGTIFKDKHYFCPQHYVRPPGGLRGQPVAVDRVATVLQSYPTAFGHFPHEILPKLVYLLDKVPQDVKFLLDVSPFTEQYLKILGIDESRVIRYQARAHRVYSAKEIYFASTDPFVDSTDPHKGGKSFLFPKNMFDLMQKRLLAGIPAPAVDARSDLVVLIQRHRAARNLTNFAALHGALSATVGADRVRVFKGTESVADAIRLFNSAAMVVGVHGAGFANVAFCKEHTHVIEIGYDSSAGMGLDNMYALLSSHTSMNYHLVRGAGSYMGPVKVNVADVISKGLGHEKKSQARKEVKRLAGVVLPIS